MTEPPHGGASRTRFHVAPAGAPLLGELAVPGDKSIGHRAVMFAALADGVSRVRGLSGGEDNRRTVAALRALGVGIADEADGALRVEGVGMGGLRAAAAPLDCGNSGTTIRLLSGVLAPAPFATTLAGDEYLHARPMGRVATPLRAMGARIEGRAGEGKARPGEVYPPLVVGPCPAGGLRGRDHRSPIASAQVKSAILLAALSADGATRVTEPARSRDHTERMLAAMGAPLRVEGLTVIVDPAGWARRLRARDQQVPGNLSSAAFLLASALLVPCSRVVVRGVGVNPTRTGVLDALVAMGARVGLQAARDAGGEPVADLVAEHGPLHGTRIAGELTVRAIDELPLLAALAAHAEGTTEIADAGELRVKESDRIAAMTAALGALGVDVAERADGWVIRGGRVAGGRVDSRGDHRIAMASAVCALAARGETVIDDTANVATSFPGFLRALASMGAPIVTEPGEAEPG